MAQYFNMSTPFSAKGIWWHSEAPEISVTGTINFDPSTGIQLVLGGTISQGSEGSTRRQYYKVLHGTVKGVPSTLFFCTYRGRTENGFAVIKEEYVCKIAVIGVHAKSDEDVSFSQLRAEYSNLGWWLHRSLFFPKNISPENSQEETLSWRSVTQHCTADIDSRNCRISLATTVKTNCDITSFSLHRSSYFAVVPTEPQRLEWCRDIVRDLNDLLTMFISVPIDCLGVTGWVVSEGNSEGHHVDLIWAQPSQYFEDNGPKDVLIKWADLEEQMPGVLQKWFEYLDEMRPVNDLLTGYIRKRDTSAIFRFLGLAQALETFHRREFGGYYIEPDEYSNVEKALARTIPAWLPSGLRDKLGSQLEHGNEYSLRKRINEILRSLKPEVLELLSISKNSFTDKAVNYRNYLTHYDEVSRPTFFSINTVNNLSDQFRRLLTVLVLRRIGVDESVTARAIHDHWYL